MDFRYTPEDPRNNDSFGVTRRDPWGYTYDPRYGARRPVSDADAAAGGYTDPYAGNPNLPDLRNPMGKEWGGHYGGAEADIGRARGMAAAYMDRQGPQIDTGLADDSRRYGVEAENGVWGVYQGGQTAADLQAAQGLRLAQSGTMSAAGQGMADQRMALATGSAMQGNMAQAESMRRAQMQMQARDMYAQMAQRQREMDQQRAFAQAQLEAEQRQRNDAMAAEAERAGFDVAGDQSTAYQRAEAQAQANQAAAAGENMRRRQARAQGRLDAATSAVALGMAGASMASDRRAKKKIRRGGVSEALRHLEPYTYEYKSEKHGKGEYVGIMAQDLERSGIGRAIVSEDADGVKRVDMVRGLSLALAAVADLDKRVKR